MYLINLKQALKYNERVMIIHDDFLNSWKGPANFVFSQLPEKVWTSKVYSISPLIINDIAHILILTQ